MAGYQIQPTKPQQFYCIIYKYILKVGWEGHPWRTRPTVLAPHSNITYGILQWFHSITLVNRCWGWRGLNPPEPHVLAPNGRPRIKCNCQTNDQLKQNNTPSIWGVGGVGTPDHPAPTLTPLPMDQTTYIKISTHNIIYELNQFIRPCREVVEESLDGGTLCSPFSGHHPNLRYKGYFYKSCL